MTLRHHNENAMTTKVVKVMERTEYNALSDEVKDRV